MTKETIGERITRLRGEMSQTELASRIKAITGDGLSRAAISLWESGATKSIKPENLLAACTTPGIVQKDDLKKKA